MKSIALRLIGFYQHHRRTVFAFIPYGTCRFEPSCSDYGRQSYERFGFLWGSALTFWRLLRCNPWTAGGDDPVPERRHKAA
jgi:putative membrane protein insertion efficiency factor